MAIPNIQVTIYFPSLGQYRDVSAVTDIDTSIEIAEAIESPAETNVYVAPDIQLKIYEGTSSEFLLSWFDSMQPDDLNWQVEIKLEGVPIFTGFILPTTLQIDEIERWAGFTAIGKAGLLARTSADTDTFKRPASSGWTVLESQGNAYLATVTIQKTTAQNSCEYVTDDVIAIDMGGGSTMELTVRTVTGTGGVLPYPSFVLSVVGLTAPATAGAAVSLVTRYFRNISLRIAVQALFNAAGLAVPTAANYNVIPIENAASPFATRPSVVGIVGYPQAVIPNVFDAPRYYPVIGTTTGTYIQYDPPLGAWDAAPNYLQGRSSEPVDWTDDNNFTAMGYWISGPRFEQREVGSDYVYIFWHYWLVNQAIAPPVYRFGIAVTVSQEPDSSGYYAAGAELYKESTMDGYTWTRTHTVTVAAAAISTLDNLHNEIGQTVGIYSTGTRSSSGKLLFTHPDGTSPTGYRAATASLSDLTGYAAVGTMRGKVRRTGIYHVDALRNTTPTAYLYQIDGGGSPLFTTTVGLPIGFQPQTLTYNDGDGFWYALAVSVERGVELLSYASSNLAPRAGYIPTQIESSGPDVASSLDLTVVRTPTLPPGAWPMVALVGSNIWWIAYSFSGLIPYLDTEGLSCADALAQLGVTVDAFFFVDAALASHFRSRAAGLSAQTIDTGVGTGSTRIDDGGCLTFRRAAIWYRTVKHAIVQNERDDTITGSAGDEGFAGTEQSLEARSRFVTTTSFAQALAQNTLGYLGRKLALIDVEHELDGRRYEIGRTFTALVGGSVNTYQVIDVTIRPADGTVHVQGLEV